MGATNARAQDLPLSRLKRTLGWRVLGALSYIVRSWAARWDPALWILGTVDTDRGQRARTSRGQVGKAKEVDWARCSCGAFGLKDGPEFVSHANGISCSNSWDGGIAHW